MATRVHTRRATAATATAILALLTAACGATQTAHTTTSTPTPHPTTGAPTATPHLPSAGTVAATITSLGGLSQKGDTYGVGADGTSVWIDNSETGVVTRVDAKSGKVVATILLHPGCAGGRGCGNLAVGDGAVWVANEVDGTITRIDPATNRAVATIDVGATVGPLVYTTPGAVWSANYGADSYSRIDPHTNTIAATLHNHLQAEVVTYSGGTVWLCDAGGDPALTALDATSFAVKKQYALEPGFCAEEAPMGSSLYIGADNGTPKVLDPATGNLSAAAVVPGSAHAGVAGGADGAWVVDADLGLFRLDPHTGAPIGQVPLAGAAGLADDGHAVWVMTGDGSLYEITPAS